MKKISRICCVLRHNQKEGLVKEIPCKLYYKAKNKYYKGPDTKLTLCNREEALVFYSKSATMRGIETLVEMGYGKMSDWKIVPLNV